MYLCVMYACEPEGYNTIIIQLANAILLILLVIGIYKYFTRH